MEQQLALVQKRRMIRSEPTLAEASTGGVVAASEISNFR
jgi:hypothetical protein